MRLGVDFGTTQVVVAACEDGNTPVVTFEDPRGDSLAAWPTLAGTDGQGWHFGPAARARVGAPGFQLLRGFKRLISGPDARLDARVPLGDGPAVSELFTAFLRALRADLGSSSSVRGGLGRPEALVAVPVAATPTQRFLTLEAFREAGFDVVGVLPEPAAAAVEYAHRQARTLNSRRERVLIYDLGGGTFDATLIDLAGGRHRALAHAGDPALGGEDLDRALIVLALEQVGAPTDWLDQPEAAPLLEHGRAVKEAIGPTTRLVLVELGAHLPGPWRAAASIGEDLVVQVSVAEFADRVRPLIARSVAQVEALVGAGAGGLEAAGVAGISVVGGASSLPACARQLREVWGHRVHRAPQPSAAVAIGLARALSDPRYLPEAEAVAGVFREGRGGAEARVDLVLPLRPGPAVVRRYRTAHNLGEYRFFACPAPEPGAELLGDLFSLGVARVPFGDGAGPVHRLSGPGRPVEERWTPREDGGLDVVFVDLDSGAERRVALPSPRWAAPASTPSGPERAGALPDPSAHP